MQRIHPWPRENCWFSPQQRNEKKWWYTRQEMAHKVAENKRPQEQARGQNENCKIFSDSKNTLATLCLLNEHQSRVFPSLFFELNRPVICKSYTMENQSMKIVLTSTKKGKKDTFGIEMNGETFLETDPNNISLPHHFCGYNWIWKTVEKVLTQRWGGILPEVAFLILCLSSCLFILMKHSYYNNLKIKAVVGKQECYLKNNVIPLDFEVVRRQKKFFGVE